MKISIQKLLNDALLEEQKKRKDKKGSGKWKPFLFGRCYRCQYWAREEIEISDPPDILSLRRFKVGKLFHKFIQNLFKKYYPEAKIEAKIIRKDIMAFVDIEIEDEVIEIKSVHSKSFWYMEKGDFDIEKDKYTNVLQTTGYAYLRRKPKARLVFISKDDLSIAEYVFDLEGKWKKEVQNELKTLRKYWKKKELPPPKPRAFGEDKKTGKSNECEKYCQYRTKCREIEKK